MDDEERCKLHENIKINAAKLTLEETKKVLEMSKMIDDVSTKLGEFFYSAYIINPELAYDLLSIVLSGFYIAVGRNIDDALCMHREIAKQTEKKLVMFDGSMNK